MVLVQERMHRRPTQQEGDPAAMATWAAGLAALHARRVPPIASAPRRRGRTVLDRALDLPAEWVADPARCQAAGVPAGRAVQTRPQLARQVMARVRALAHW